MQKGSPGEATDVHKDSLDKGSASWPYQIDFIVKHNEVVPEQNHEAGN